MKLFYDPWPYDPEFSPGKGSFGSKYMFVGIAPSMKRPKARFNEPFGSRSWSLLRRILSEAPPGGVYLTNLVRKPMPANKKLPKRDVRFGLQLLHREIKQVRPYRILALGTEPAKELCPGFTEMRDDHGVLFTNDHLSELVGHRVIVVPTYHFSAIGRDPFKKPLLARDLERFFELPDPEMPKFTVLNHKVPQFREGSRIYLDLETEGFDPLVGNIKSLGLGVDYSDTALMYKNPDRDLLLLLYDRIKVSGSTLVGQNFQFDLYWLTHKTDIFWDVLVEDTMLHAHNQGEKVVGLKHLSTMYTDRPGPHAFGGFDDLGYAAEDIHATKAVSAALHEKREPRHVDRMMWRAVPELVGMRYRGVYVDRPLLQDLAKQYEKEVEKQETKLVQEWGQAALQVNWNSNAEVVALFKANGIRLTEMTDSGNYTIKESVLLNLVEDFPKVQTLLDFRAVQKTLTGFFHGYLELTSPEHPFLHPDQDLRGAETGRTSMKRPNLQQVTRTGPSKLIFKSRWYRDDTGRVWNILDFLRRYGVQRTYAEIAHGRLQPAGRFGLIDLQQAELRGACLVSNDMVMCQAIRSGDPHRYAASIAFHLKPEDVPADKRKKVKGVVFGKLYGGSSAGLAKRIGIGVREVEEVDRAVFGAFKTLAQWLKDIKRFGVDNLYVEDTFGRRRDLSELMYFEGASSVARKACNTPIQALASHMAMTILTETSINCRTRDLLSAPLFGVHDSTLLDIHPDEPDWKIHEAVQDAFYSLNFTPLREMPMWEHLPIEGELVIGKGWAAVESTSDYYDREGNTYYNCGTQLPPSEVLAPGRTVLSLA